MISKVFSESGTISTYTDKVGYVVSPLILNGTLEIISYMKQVNQTDKS